MTAYPGGLCRERSMAQPPNRCAVAFSVSCEQWKSPALLHAKRELLPRSLWLQGHVMLFTSYQSTDPAQIGCFSSSSDMWAFYRNTLCDSNTQELNMVRGWGSITTEWRRMPCLHHLSPSSSSGKRLVLFSGQVASYLGYTELVTQTH